VPSTCPAVSFHTTAWILSDYRKAEIGEVSRPKYKFLVLWTRRPVTSPTDFFLATARRPTELASTSLRTISDESHKEDQYAYVAFRNGARWTQSELQVFYFCASSLLPVVSEIVVVALLCAFGSVRSALIVQNSTSPVSYYAPTLLFPGASLAIAARVDGPPPNYSSFFDPTAPFIAISLGDRYVPSGLTTELYYERSNPLPKGSAAANLYSGRIIFIKSWDDPPESDLFPWLELACTTASAVVRKFKNFSCSSFRSNV
jgi:hypothetical protein